MKKVFIFLIGVLLISALAIAVTFSAKQDAIDYITNYKDNIVKGNIEVANVTIISDKDCFINYETEKVDYCQICISYVIDNIPEQNCVKVSEASSEKEDLARIQEFVLNRIKTIKTDYPYVSYTDRVMEKGEYKIVKA